MEAWIDRPAATRGMDPDQLDSAGRVLMRALDQTTEVKARRQWEQLSELITKSSWCARLGARVPARVTRAEACTPIGPW